ncbi:MAG: coenzyme A pyrophosphatase [Candidatus Aminicenantes bacterium RBG_19FT_COMBO_59_29]|nr:MAG: coenzyme A pyrophosphatase [Candidatus Aminicenantes bacterium RBG_19FT_COMBO_59_29]
MNRSPADLDLSSLERRLQGEKPGLRSQLRMVPDPRPGDKTYQEAGDTCLRAAVLVLIYPRGDGFSLVLTRRTSRVAHHQAQISFPGGQMDKDESPVETALREAEEELNIMPAEVRVLGELTPLYIPPSNYCIYPVVAAAERRPDFRPSPHEVAEVIEAPLAHLLDMKNIKREKWPLRGMIVTVPFYFFKGHKIWGATAMVLAELLDLIK